MTSFEPEFVLLHLEAMLTDARRERMERVLDQRTQNLALVFENVHDPHNVSACIRTAEALGVQDIHVIEGPSSFKVKAKVVQGAENWVDIHRHLSPESCLRKLKNNGFLIAAGAPTEHSVPISEIDFSRPVALVFGNEHEGLSPEVLTLADHCFEVPMLGFTRSFNISVSAALSLYHAVTKRIELLGQNGDLDPDRRLSIKADWIRQSVPMSDQILGRLKIENEQTFELPLDERDETDELSAEDLESTSLETETGSEGNR